MVTDITDIVASIRGYMVRSVREYTEDIDTSENSVFDDIFIKPVINLLIPFLDNLSKVELKSNLANAEFLTDDEIDEIGIGNYFLERKSGTSASTNLTLTFTNLNLEDPNFMIKIPAGTEFSTSSDIQFQTQAVTILSAEDMRNNYNKQKLVYEIDIPVFASAPGAAHNVFAGEIIANNTFFSSSLISVVNKLDVINGKDKESNEAYIDRIKDFYLSRQLGTAPGYRNFIMDMFEEINDVYVAGYKNEFMLRDLVKVVDEITGDIIDKHIGGAVDLYLKGCIFDDDEKEIELANNIVVINEDFSNLSNAENPLESLLVYNLSDSTKAPVIKEVRACGQEEYGTGFDGKIRVMIDNTNDVSYNSNGLSSMKIVFNLIIDGERTSDEIYFNCGTSEGELAGPVKSIDLLLGADDKPVENINERIEIIRSGIAATTSEKCTVKLINMDDFYNGYPFRVKFTANKTLRNLNVLLNDELRRIITADVMGLEAKPIPVNIRFKLKVKDEFANADKTFIETRIKASVIEYFNKYKLGDDVEESDLVGWMYTDPSVNEAIQYINLPFDVFYIPDNINEDIPTDGSEHADNGILPIKAITYPVLNANKFKVEILV